MLFEIMFLNRHLSFHSTLYSPKLDTISKNNTVVYKSYQSKQLMIQLSYPIVARALNTEL